MKSSRMSTVMLILFAVVMLGGGADAQTDDKPGKWANLLRFEWSLDGAAPGSTDQAPAQESGQLADVVMTLTKDVDGASPILAEACSRGTTVKSLRLCASSKVGDKRQHYAYELRNVMVTSYLILAPGEGDRPEGLANDAPIEVVTLRISGGTWNRIGSAAWGQISSNSWERIGSAMWGRIGSAIWGRIGSGVWGEGLSSGVWGGSAAASGWRSATAQRSRLDSMSGLGAGAFSLCDWCRNWRRWSGDGRFCLQQRDLSAQGMPHD